jgi:transcriptional regulator with XRE-family HTH domain
VLRKPAHLTGSEIRFLRHIVGLSLQKFGEELGITAPGVKKWEDLKEKEMRSVTTDFAIRNFVARRLSFEHNRYVDIAVHRSILEASEFWKPEPIQIPYHVMKEFRRNRVHSSP